MSVGGGVMWQTMRAPRHNQVCELAEKAVEGEEVRRGEPCEPLPQVKPIGCKGLCRLEEEDIQASLMRQAVLSTQPEGKRLDLPAPCTPEPAHTHIGGKSNFWAGRQRPV